jgi:hypothetical protein
MAPSGWEPIDPNYLAELRSNRQGERARRRGDRRGRRSSGEGHGRVCGCQVNTKSENRLKKQRTAFNESSGVARASLLGEKSSTDFNSATSTI